MQLGQHAYQPNENLGIPTSRRTRQINHIDSKGYSKQLDLSYVLSEVISRTDKGAVLVWIKYVSPERNQYSIETGTEISRRRLEYSV